MSSMWIVPWSLLCQPSKKTEVSSFMTLKYSRGRDTHKQNPNGRHRQKARVTGMSHVLLVLSEKHHSCGCCPRCLSCGLSAPCAFLKLYWGIIDKQKLHIPCGHSDALDVRPHRDTVTTIRAGCCSACFKQYRCIYSTYQKDTCILGKKETIFWGKKLSKPKHVLGTCAFAGNHCALKTNMLRKECPLASEIQQQEQSTSTRSSFCWR